MLRFTLIIITLLLINLPVCNSQSWIKADSLRMKYLFRQVYDSALYYSTEVQALIRGTEGENNLIFADALNKVAISYFYLGSYKKSEYFILQEIALREALKSDNDVSYLNALENASVICRKAGNYEEALKQVKKAEKKSLRIYGSTGLGYARTLSFCAGVCYDTGTSVNDIVYLREALRYYEKAETINAEKENTKYALMVNRSDMAAYNNDIGNLPLAEKLFREVISSAAEEGYTGNYAAALNNLAVFYYNTGDFKQAEKFLVNAIDICSQNNQTIPGLYAAISINNLAALYSSLGNYVTALKLLTNARDIFEERFQVNNPAYAVLLNNVAAVYMSQEYYAEPQNKNPDNLSLAGKNILKADSIFGMNCSNPHPDGYILNGNCAIWYYLNGDKLKCAQMLFDNNYESNLSLRVHAMMNKMAVSAPVPFNEEQKSRPSVEPSMIPIKMDFLYRLSAEANVISTAGLSPVSDALANGMVEIMFGKANNLKRSVGEYHPAYLYALRALMEIYTIFGNESYEEELTLNFIKSITFGLLQDFSFLAESEKEMYYQAYLKDIHSFMDYALSRKIKNPAITGYAYNNVLLNKGLMLKSSNAMRISILGSNDPGLLSLYDEWISVQKELSDLYSTPVELRTKNLSETEKKANELERILVGRSQDFSQYRKSLQITWEDVKNNLKSDEAAIEFTDFKLRAQDSGNDVIYCALIVKPDMEYPEMIKLFTGKELSGIISDGNDFSSVNELYGTIENNNTRLFDMLWKPIEPYLSGVRNIYISPSGLLYRISFPSISAGKNIFLCDNYNIHIESSTGNLAWEQIPTVQISSALIFGGIRYGGSNDNLVSNTWEYLEGTKNEGDTIFSILEENKFNVSYLTEDNATETFFKQNAGRYDVIHIATHGFFFDDPNNIRFEGENGIEYGDISFRGTSGTIGVNSFVNNENPLMRSGLVFAGANDVWSFTENQGTDDGVLTAQEVTQIDLRKNDLVVLSACETGLGDIKGNEGVYGLQRSLKMAGVKDIIMSLWEIPDKETVEFMCKFYEYFTSEKNIWLAFKMAQHEMRLKYDPYYWAAFVLME